MVGTAFLGIVNAGAWWESAVVYQIYPRSFKDSNNDGVGDLNGITLKLPYLKDLGVDAIWMSPIFKSPMQDFGYDITDYRAIDETFGTMQDFHELMKHAKRLGIRIILDYVPNHTSTSSEWFIKSIRNNDTYADYYIWANGTTDANNNRIPPNNWISKFRKSAWEYNEDRKQYYLHQFVIGQPDLNYRHPQVQEEMKDVLRFWLEKGVSGFRIDAVNMLFEVNPADYGGKYPNEPLSNEPGYGPDDYEYLTHIYTKDQNETYDVVYDWRTVLDQYEAKDNESKLMMTEAYTDIEHMMRYYGNATRNGSIPFNFVFLGELNGTSTAAQIQSTINKWMQAMPAGKLANWVNGNHDHSRMATRYGDNRVDAMNMLALLLPGVTITYQGEELGMTDGEISWEETVDPQACNTDDPLHYQAKSRDPCRTPFHWDNSTNAGFSTANKTWLPVASNYATVNVAIEQAANRSHYKFYKDVVALKHTSAVSTGALNTTVLSDNVLVITRSLPNVTVVGVVNLANSTQDVDLNPISVVPKKLTVVASGVSCTLEKAFELERGNLSMPAYCAIVLEGVNNAYRITATSIFLYSIFILFMK
ncbi:unnamed protein product [Arctia plantaginis]|uniref:alpha-glucosidase n=1 Tax=Arctia plantaginis TaxID=874455 RepID=A0A8S1AF45_ARCPL|nr:unnamed protein product [Arctia plantaginis]